MPRAIWSGAISFGLVNIPVELYPATRDDHVRFNQLHATDHGRVQYQKVCSVDGEALAPEDIVRGVAVGRDEYIVIEDKELEDLEPEKSRLIDITEFVALAEIDPIYFDRPYYLVPAKNAAKAYHLLRRAMLEADKVGIATFVMRSKEYLVALRPQDTVLLLATMRFADEIVDLADLGGLGEEVEIKAKELKMAAQLIDSLADTFEPEEFHDAYIEQVRALIAAKSEGREVVTAGPGAQRPAKVLDLASALEQSLAQLKAERTKATKSTAAKKPAAKKTAAKKAAKKTTTSRKKAS